MNVYIIAGENSGDFIGAQLIKAIKDQCRTKHIVPEFNGIGGALMREAGMDSLFPMHDISLMGYAEILPRIFKLKGLIDKTVEDILSTSPSIVVTIDSPGFTYRVAEKVRSMAPHIKLVHYVAPSVWAIKPARAAKYAKIYDRLLTLFPFEPKYFIKEGLSSICVGHPVLAEQEFLKKSKKTREALGVLDDSKIVVVTPGSRRAEIKRHMPVVCDALNHLSSKHKIKVIFVQPNEQYIQYITTFLEQAQFDSQFSTNRLVAFAGADVALAKSGTNTLELAASGTPMIVAYKLNLLSYYFVKMFIKVKYVSLINIIPNKKIVQEYLQKDFTSEKINKGLDKLLTNETKAKAQVKEAHKVLKSIGFGAKEKPSELAAKHILEMII